jgi:hypothetical protein
VSLLLCRGYSILFATLGAFVIPMWIPLLGSIVTAFTFVVPGSTVSSKLTSLPVYLLGCAFRGVL